MGLSMARCVVLSMLLPWLVGGSVLARPEPQLSARQTILEANRHLIADGWRPAPGKRPTPEERRWASVALESLSACSGIGVGFCRFDYRRALQRLSVVTVPSEPGRPSVGRVERWW
ncbi:hypothetical protein Syncc8109_0912 [Synechococcus sp. WH 8109]|nr:hypothetical protein Syncc8109_0912 [Synechococcus sp. WH 8109]